MRKYHNNLIIVAVLAFVTCVHAQTRYVIVGPGEANTETLKTMLLSVAEVTMRANANDEVHVMDGLTQHPVATITIPQRASDRARARLFASAVGPIRTHYNATSSDSPAHAVHVPNLLTAVARQTTAGGEGFTHTRILLLGSAFFGDGTDVRFDFAAGQYPSPGHIAATRELSVYGTADASTLRNTRLDWLNLAPIADDRDRLYIQKFWTLYAQQRGVTLTSWATDYKTATKNVLSALSESIEEVQLNPDDLRREIRRVDGLDQLPNIWSLVFVVDASASMRHAFDQIRAEIPILAERLYDTGATIRVSVVPFRQTPLPVFPLTVIRSEGSDGGTSIAKLQEFLDGVTPTSAAVDPDPALRVGMGLVDADQHRPTYTCLILVGDTTAELNRDDGRRAQLADDLKAWVDAAKGRTVQGIYVGQRAGNHNFGWIVAISGRPIDTHISDLADSIVERAANVTRGIKPE